MSVDSAVRQSVSDAIHEYLIENEGESPKVRNRGIFYSQSFKKLFEFVDPDDVVQIQARRQIKNKSESFPSLMSGDVGEYTRSEEQIKVSYSLDYDKAEHGKFDYQGVLDDIERKELTDLPVERVVIQKDHSILFEELSKMFDRVDEIGFVPNEFREPFYFVMESRSAGLKRQKEQVRRNHPEWYFTYDESGEHDRLGWKLRTLDLVEIWSHNAWTESGNIVASCPTESGDREDLTQQGLEDLAFNHIGSSRPVFGAVNSKIVISRWKTLFDTNMTGIKSWQWDSDGQWARTE